MTDDNEIRPAGGFREQPGYDEQKEKEYERASREENRREIEDGVALTSAAHPQDEKTIERLCRAVCKVYRIPADLQSEGAGGVMPKGQVYKLWEAQRDVVQAVLDELAVIRGEQLNSEIFVATGQYTPIAEPVEIATVTGRGNAGEVIEIQLLEGETIQDACARLGL